MPRYNPTKKSIYEANVARLDDIGTDINQFIQQEGMNGIERAAADFITRVKENIDQERDFVVTGEISDIEMKAEDGFLNIYAPKHLIYQDRGVNGSETRLYPESPHFYSDKRPPVQPIIDWIKRKKINLRDNQKYSGEAPPFNDKNTDSEIKKAAYGIREKIFKEGFKPRNIYSKEIPQLVTDVQAELADFVLQSINQVIDVKDEAKRIIIR